MAKIENGDEASEVSKRFALNNALGKAVTSVTSIFVLTGIAFGFITVFLGWFALGISLMLLKQILPILLIVVILLVVIEKVGEWEQLSPLRTFLFRELLFCGVYFAILELSLMSVRT